MRDYKTEELRKVFAKYGFEDYETPMAEQLGIRSRDDDYPRHLRGSDTYYYYSRDLGLGYRQQLKTILVMKVEKTSGKYRIIKKGYEGLRTPSHPDGKWIW